jgi:hypothetical protein
MTINCTYVHWWTFLHIVIVCYSGLPTQLQNTDFHLFTTFGATQYLTEIVNLWQPMQVCKECVSASIGAGPVLTKLKAIKNRYACYREDSQNYKVME